MSAFVVSDKHIKALVRFAAGKHENRLYWRDENGAYSIVKDPRDVMQAEEVANILKAENVRSYCYRYPEEQATDYNAPIELDPFIFYRTMPVSAVQALKACNCYDYQTCETPDYEDTPAHRIISQIRQFAIMALPGYEGAAWEIS